MKTRPMTAIGGIFNRAWKKGEIWLQASVQLTVLARIDFAFLAISRADFCPGIWRGNAGFGEHVNVAIFLNINNFYV